MFKITPDRVGATRVGGYTLTLFRVGHDRYDARLTRQGELVGVWRDFRPSPMHAVDAPETWACIWGFVTLRDGDTDAEYFADYTPEMLAFSEGDAETVGWLASERFGEY